MHYCFSMENTFLKKLSIQVYRIQKPRDRIQKNASKSFEAHLSGLYSALKISVFVPLMTPALAALGSDY
jgi:hypothetical protein